MKRLGSLLLTSTCSLGAGYYFGYRHQENTTTINRQSPSSTTVPYPPPSTLLNKTPQQFPPQLIEQKETHAIIPSSPSDGVAPVVEEQLTSNRKDQKLSISPEKDKVSSATMTDKADEQQLKNLDHEQGVSNEEGRTVSNLKEEIYQYLENQDHSIRWPKYNIQFLSDDTEENRQATVKLFKTFDGLGIPSHAGAVHLFSHYISVSDSRMRMPLYVAWTIPHLHNEMTVTADRKFSKFEKGTFYDHFTSFNPDNNDYLGSGYSRGHLVNCGDFNYFDQKSMNDTHLLIHNIVPQDLKNNAGYWLRMERFTRLLAYDFDSVHVIAGPAMIPEMFESQEVNGRLQAPKGSLKHLIIGNNHVSVPTHLFRIIIAEKNADNQPSEYYTQAFLVPNTEIEKTDELTKYSVSLKELEGITGLRFLDKLEKSGNMLPLCSRPFTHEEASDKEERTTGPSDTDADNSIIPQQTVKYGCDCLSMFPPWQDLDIQELLWKNTTESEIEEKWNHLVETTNWTPSKDITERKKAKLEELKRNISN